MGEHLGYLFTGLWSVLTGVAIVGTELVPAWMGWLGIVVGVGLIVGSAEFLGRDEGKRLGSGRRGDPHPVRRVVPVAPCPGHRADHLTFGADGAG